MFVAGAFLIFLHLTTNEGVYAQHHRFSYVVSIRTHVNDTHFCVGSVIHRKWILTAAACFSNETKPEELVVYADTVNSKGVDGVSRRVKNLIIHPWYEKSPTSITHNIALLQLQNSLYWFWKPWIPTAKVPTVKAGRVGLGENVVSVGWGTFSEGDRIKVERTMSLVELVTADSEPGGCQSNTDWICVVGRENQTAVCFGDIGEPLIYRTGDKDKLVGLSSNFHECDSGQAQGFIRIEP